MRHHFITIMILALAVACYLAGYSGMGNTAFIVGAGFETWFWIRLLIKRQST